MWRFFCPSGFAVRWEVLQPLTRIFILPWFKPQVTPSTLYKFLIIYENLNYAAVAHYDAASLSAISHMGIGPGKGFTHNRKAAFNQACVHRLITGGERWSG